MQIYQTKKEKILKVIQIIYDIISALFIVFVSVSLAIGSNKGENGSKEQLTPTIQQRRNAVDVWNDNFLSYQTILNECDIYEANYRYLAIESTPLNIDTPFYVVGYDSLNSMRCYRVYKSRWTQPNNGDFSYQLNFYCIDFTSVLVYYDYEHSNIVYNDFTTTEGVKFSARYLAVPSNFDIDSGDSGFKAIFNHSEKIYSSNNGFNSTITLDDNFNYNALGQPSNTIGSLSAFMIRSANSPFVDYLMNSSSIQTTIDYPIGYFVSNNGLFDTIRATMINSQQAKWVDIDGNVISSSSIGINNMHLGAIVDISYYNSFSGATIPVWQRDVFYQGSDKVYNNSGTWLTDDYKTFRFINDLSPYYDALLSNINNGRSNNDYIVGGATLNNAFDLIGSTFSAVVPFLSIQLLPGVSILLIMLIPFAITLVIAIVKLLRK